MDTTGPIRIAYFISSHGFGHAARACAVMDGLHSVAGNVSFDLFTRVPRWFFEGSLQGDFEYHSVLTDVGVVQTDALTEDLDKTVAHLDRFYPLNPDTISGLSRDLRRVNCRLVICDIAPMGIAVAHHAGIPSVLIENFTWDWIYAGYVRMNPRMSRHVDYLAGLFDSADYHIQTEPVCSPCDADMVTPPFSRPQRHTREQTRDRFGISPDEKIVTITMGGSTESHAFLEQLKSRREIRFLIPGSSTRLAMDRNLVMIPHHPDYYHPDLIRASDAVVGKVGYGTISEVYDAGVPFGYISRRESRESGPLTDFVRCRMPGIPVSEAAFRDGTWIRSVDKLLAIPKVIHEQQKAAAGIAEFVLAIVD